MRYRVVCVGRVEPREVVVTRRDGWLYVDDHRFHEATDPRCAIAHHAWDLGWPVVEIRGPGEMTTAEAVAAEREAAHAARDGMTARHRVAKRVAEIRITQGDAVLREWQASQRRPGTP